MITIFTSQLIIGMRGIQFQSDKNTPLRFYEESDKYHYPFTRLIICLIENKETFEFVMGEFK